MQATHEPGVLDSVVEMLRSISGDAFDPARPLGDAGLDSLGYAELALALEERFDVRLCEADVARLRTADAVALAVGRLRGGSPAERIPAGLGRHQERAERLLAPVLERWYRVRITGREHIPREGAAVVCANHNSLLDIPFLAIAVPRPIAFMAKVELFSGIGRPLFHALGGFPVRRQANDLRAIDTALAVLERGGLLGMFPEGTRSRDRLLPFLPGAAWVALTRGAPIVPTAITGAAESMPRGTFIPKRTRVTVGFAEPVEVELEPDPRRRAERAKEITAELRRRVEGLLTAAPAP